MNALMQSLESRKLLAAVTATLTNGSLVVTGTEAGETIFLSPADSGVGGVNGVGVFVGNSDTPVAKYRADKIKSVLIDARGGSDLVYIDYTVELPRSGSNFTPVTLRGGNGNDQVFDYRGDRNTLVDGQAGDDTLAGGDTLRGGTGRDTIYGYSSEGGEGSDNYIDAGADNDTVFSEGGSDTIFGQAGDDQITVDNRVSLNGAAAYSIVDAGTGNDRVDMLAAGTVHLGDGNDRLYFNYFYDADRPISGGDFYGDAGNDFVEMKYDVTPNAKRVFTVHGGDGNDQIVGDSGHLYAETFYGDAGDDNLSGGYGSDRLYGGTGNDVLGGNYGNDRLYGGDGQDTLYGANGYDYLYGEAGQDELHGGLDNDTLDGGTGNNRFYGDAGRDTIHSKNGVVDQIFTTDAGDTLDRDAIDVLVA